MVRPSPGNHEYGAVLKFNSPAEWRAFGQSVEYLQFVAEIGKYIDKEPQVETICGLESWFTPLGAHIVSVPPRWKMALITWIGVCFAVYVVTLLLTPITGQWPWFLNFIAINAGVVVSLTWCVMPILNKLFRAWLLPEDTD